MTSQGDIYDIVQDNVEYQGFGVASFLFSQKVSRTKIRGNLQIRYGTADALEKFTNTIVNETDIQKIDWNSSKPRLWNSGDSWSYPTSFEIDDVSETFDQVLLSAYNDILLKHRTEELLEALSRGDISRTARIISALIYRHTRVKGTTSIDSSFIWDAYRLVETEDYERMARRDILNELVRIGCITRDGSDVYPLPEFESIETPGEYLPLPTIPEEWES